VEISVIIPTYNRKNVLKHTILSLINQGLKEYEVIVCDDGSDDGTFEMMQDLNKQNLPFTLVYRRQNKIGFRAAAARNMGIKAAKGKVVIFIDQDVILEPNVLSLFREIKNGTVYIGLKRLMTLDFYESKITDDVVKSNFDVFKEVTFSIKSTVSSLGVITKEDLDKVGGFDEDFTSYGLEDTEFTERLQDIKISCVFDSRLVGFHVEHPKNVVVQQMQDIYHHKRSTRRSNDGKVMIRGAILYLTHNRFDYTKESLMSIIKNTPRDKYDLLVWDNCTTEEGMLDWLREVCKDNNFDYVFCKKNAGLTTAMNQQMRIMRKRNIYDVFCHIANDVVVPPGWLDATFNVIKTNEVGCVGLNLEPESNFEKVNINGTHLEKLRTECNVGGMHFCIPMQVYDLLGGFQHVSYGYGQQDANYSLKVKLMPNQWWIYYLDKDVYKGRHLGVNNALELNEKNAEEELYKDYHNKMRQMLKYSGGDITGGRNFRAHLMNIRRQYDNKQITYEQFLEVYRVPESKFVNVEKEDILETTISKEFFK